MYFKGFDLNLDLFTDLNIWQYDGVRCGTKGVFGGDAGQEPYLSGYHVPPPEIYIHSGSRRQVA